MTFNQAMELWIVIHDQNTRLGFAALRGIDIHNSSSTLAYRTLNVRQD
ncbi:MAG: hypothetical protein VB860_10890 [Dehalococcoidia bacterium]